MTDNIQLLRDRNGFTCFVYSSPSLNKKGTVIMLICQIIKLGHREAKLLSQVTQLVHRQSLEAQAITTLKPTLKNLAIRTPTQ